MKDLCLNNFLLWLWSANVRIQDQQCGLWRVADITLKNTGERQYEIELTLLPFNRRYQADEPENAFETTFVVDSDEMNQLMSADPNYMAIIDNDGELVRFVVRQRHYYQLALAA